MSEYPRMMFHPDGRSMPVNSADEKSAIGSDWSTEPSEIHRAPQLRSAPEAVQPSPTTGNPIGDDFVDKVIARMKEEFPSLTSSGSVPAAEAPRRGPGRPPKSTYETEE